MDQFQDADLTFLIDALDRRHPSWMMPQLIDRLGSRAREAVPAAVEALRDRDLHMRMWAARTLGLIAEHAVDAVPDLIQALDDDDWGVRQSALEALRRITGEG